MVNIIQLIWKLQRWFKKGRFGTTRMCYSSKTVQGYTCILIIAMSCSLILHILRVWPQWPLSVYKIEEKARRRNWFPFFENIDDFFMGGLENYIGKVLDEVYVNQRRPRWEIKCLLSRNWYSGQKVTYPLTQPRSTDIISSRCEWHHSLLSFP